MPNTPKRQFTPGEMTVSLASLVLPRSPSYLKRLGLKQRVLAQPLEAELELQSYRLHLFVCQFF